MNESPTPGQETRANGFVPSPFWADAVIPTVAPLLEATSPEVPAEVAPGAYDGVPAPRVGDELAEPLVSSVDVADVPIAGPGAAPAPTPELIDVDGSDPAADAADAEADPSAEFGEPGEPGEAANDTKDDAEQDDEHDEEEEEPKEDAASAVRSRFAELVEERVRRAHYAHHLTRAIFTPTETATAVVVERRAAIWVPTLTFVATLVSAAAAVVLATRLHGDPADPTGHQLLIVMITVFLLAAAFGILLRAEVHYERLRPRGRTVRHDVADAYEIVRDAPRRLVRIDAPLDVLRRITDLLPAAEQLVDALVEYAAEGGSRVREHPAYERILRMRAEVEALEVMLAERAERSLEETLGRQPRVSDVRDVGDGAPLPRPEQVVDYAGLADLAATLDPNAEV